MPTYTYRCPFKHERSVVLPIEKRDEELVCTVCPIYTPMRRVLTIPNVVVKKADRAAG